MTTTEIPTLTSVEDAHTLLRQLAVDHEWVSVFWDRGWGDSGQTAEISIIVGGNGQQPKAHLTADVYRALLAQEIIPPNSLKTFKARRLHDFTTPPPAEKTGPTAAEVAEKVIRSVLDEMADVPVQAEFYRGLDPDSHLPRVMHEHAETPAFDGSRRFVCVRPGGDDAIVGAHERDFLGPRLVGEVAFVAYPTDGGVVDEGALRAALVEAIRSKHAELASIEQV